MIDPQHVPPVDDDELLAQFIVDSDHIRQDGSFRPQLFVPYKWVELSVNRHRDSAIEETWSVGSQVAVKRGMTLLGRADILAGACRISPLCVGPRPLPDNSNHADISGFPPAKPDQMSLASKLAAAIEVPWTASPSPTRQ